MSMGVLPIANCVINIVTTIVAIFGNLSTLLAIWTTPSLHSPSNVLLFSLALTDFGVGIIVQPLYIITSLTDGLVGEVEVAFMIIACVLSAASLLTITAICVDRHLALYLHLRYHVVVTTERVVNLLIFIWLGTIAASSSSIWFPLLFKLLSGLALLVSILINGILYFKMYRLCRRHQRQIQDQAHLQEEGRLTSLSRAKYNKSVLTLGLVYLVLVLCYTPCLVTFISLLVQKFFKTVELRFNTEEVSLTVMFANSCLNPFLYCWRMKEIRAAVKEQIKRILPCWN